jgi:hypothetical protein
MTLRQLQNDLPNHVRLPSVGRRMQAPQIKSSKLLKLKQLNPSSMAESQYPRNYKKLTNFTNAGDQVLNFLA